MPRPLIIAVPSHGCLLQCAPRVPLHIVGCSQESTPMATWHRLLALQQKLQMLTPRKPLVLQQTLQMLTLLDEISEGKDEFTIAHVQNCFGGWHNAAGFRWENQDRYKYVQAKTRIRARSGSGLRAGLKVEWMNTWHLARQKASRVSNCYHHAAEMAIVSLTELSGPRT